MTNNDNILDELFRSKLDDFEQVPPSYVWMKIQEKQKAGKKKVLWQSVRAGSIAAALLLAFLLGWQLQEHRNPIEEKPVVAEQKQSENQKPQRGITGTGEPGEPAVQGKAISEKKASLSYSINQKERILIADDRTNVQEPASMQSSAQSVPLPVTDDVPVESPEPVATPESSTTGRSSEEPFLTEADRAIIEMNKKLYPGDSKKKEVKSWSVGALVAPAYSVNQSSYSAEYAGSMSSQGEKYNISLGGGISVAYQAGKRWSVQSGLHYSRLNQSPGSDENNALQSDVAAISNYNNKVQRESTAGPLLMNGSAGVIRIEKLPASVRVSTAIESLDGRNDLLLNSDNFEQRFEYIEVPLLVRYKMIDKRWGMDMLGGFSANLLVGNEVYLNNGSSDSHVGKTKDMSRLNYSANVGFGMGYRLSNKIELRVEPQLKYYLNSLSNNPDVNFKPYSIGVYTGVSYRF